MKMLIRQLRVAAAARRARQKPDLQQIRLIDVLQRDGLLTDGRSQRLKAHWAAAVIFHDGGKHAAVNRVEAQMVNLKLTERVVGSLGRNHTVVADLCKIAYTAQQAVCDTRRSARTGRNLPRARRLDLNSKQRGRSHDDALQFLCGIQFQTQLHAEAVTQRAGQLPGSGRCTDERKVRQIKPDGVGRRALAYDDIDGKILHGRI